MKDYLFNIHDIVIIVTVCECILLAILQSLMPSQNRQAQVLLSVFFVCICLGATSILLLWNTALQHISYVHTSFLPIVFTLSALLKGPALYFYLRVICGHSFRSKQLSLLHLTPVIVATLLILIFQIRGDELLIGADGFRGQFTLALMTANKLTPVIYAVLGVYTVRNASNALMNHYSDESEEGASWINVLAIGYLVHWCWSLVTHFLGVYKIDLSIADFMGITDNYLAFVMINLLFIFGLYYAHRLMAAVRPKDSHRKSPQTGLPSEASERIISGIKVDKLYLEHNINVEQFARRVGLTSRDVSQSINSQFDSNFFEFINSYRVQEAKRLLASKEHQSATILEILYDSGFNSKSAFNRFFKRMTGISPSDYRKQHLN